MYKTADKETGFSLLELMLVLALIALLLTAGLALYQQKMQNFRIEKTALQMQQWLEASIAYRADPNNPGWPVSADTLITMNYMPKGSDLIAPFCVTGNCYRVRPYPDEASPGEPQLLVTTTIPSEYSNAVQIAGLVAARLPNATNKKDGESEPTNTVYAYTTVPSISGNNTSSAFGGVEIIKSGVTSPQPITCPNGQEMRVYYALATINGARIYPPPSTDPAVSITAYTSVPLDPKHWQNPAMVTYGQTAPHGGVCQIDNATGKYINCFNTTEGNMIAIKVCEQADAKDSKSARTKTIAKFIY